MATIGRAIEKGETHGFMKVLVDAATQEILGGTILGVGEMKRSTVSLPRCTRDNLRAYWRVPFTSIRRCPS